MMDSFGCEQVRWDLTELCSGLDDPRIEQILTDGFTAATDFRARYAGRVGVLKPLELCEAYTQLEALWSPLYKVSQYASLKYSIDSVDTATKALVNRLDDREAEISNLLVFFRLELAATPEPIARLWLSDPVLTNYHYRIEQIRKNAAHNLSEPEEKIINLKDITGCAAFRKLYEEFTSAFQFDIEVDGRLRKMTGAELRNLRYHPDRELRARAMQLFFSRYQDQALVFTNIYNSIVKDYATEKDLRGYDSAIQIMNKGNDLPDKAIEVLHDVTTASTPLVSRYYALKARILNMPDMTLSDIYAPLPDSTRQYTWQQAVDTVLRGLSQFDDEAYCFVKGMFEDRRVDAPVVPHKRGGAFCSSSTPDIRPYVLMNFLGNPRDVATLAHEMGHAYHDELCKKQTLFNYHPRLPLAETASVFCEMIITRLLLSEETDRMGKIALLSRKLEDVFATSHRQNMFSRFEIQAHARIADKFTGAEELCELYHNELKVMFGNTVRIAPEYHWEWATIPHIVNVPFYVYAYNFGNLLVMALYQQYLNEGKAFLPKYKQFLSQGASRSPAAICQLVGADITSPAFWQGSLRYIGSLVDELESLCQGL